MIKYYILIILSICLNLFDNTCNAVSKPLTTSAYKNFNPIETKIKAAYNPWQHTSIIGSVDNPTIDGGIINSTDNIPINHFMNYDGSTINNNTINSPKVTLNFNEPSRTQKNQFVNDNWATSRRIKDVLENAIRTKKLQYVLKQSSNLNLPASVALVPIIESDYKDNAISNKGATGSWQLMPSTAIEYGLNPQERTNFIPETNAALVLLKNLHDHFGNWDLAFAAYNAGSFRVDNALKESPFAHSVYDLNLPIETKNYVSSIHQIGNLLTQSNIVLT